jgi:hypothetical protein
VRIAYICHYDAFRTDGVVEKISTQAAEWRRHGHIVEIFCIAPPAAGREPAMHARIFSFAGYRQRAGATLKLARAVRAYAPECIYMRGDLWLPPLGRLLRSRPSIVEINGDLSELSMPGRPRSALLYGMFSNAIMLRSAAGLVFVNNELAGRQIFSGFKKARVVIANGAKLPTGRALPAPDNARPRLALLAGAPLPWQGLDKVLWLAEHMPEADFDLIGPSESDLPAAPPDNVTIHGMLSTHAYESILLSCDVGIGTIALHRKDCSESSPLKTREYLLAGLPVILGYQDTDFIGEDPWYILTIANTESNVRDHVDEIRAFVERACGRRAPREELATRIGSPAKEAERLRFFERVVAERV